MKRRTFMQNCAAGFLTLIPSKPQVSLAAEAAEFEVGFRRPPASARVKTWWHWMNGNVTAEGITHDLEAMQRVGIGGFQLFQISVETPKGPVAYESPQHLQLLEHAATEADRLGLEFAMMNGPGWSTSGGPWITPELSMQQLTWSETFVTGGKTIHITLPQPYTKLGYYRDAFLLAFPSLAGEERPSQELLSQVTSSSGAVDVNSITGWDLSKGVEIRPSRAGQPAYLQLEFAEPFEARSAVAYLFAPDLLFLAQPSPVALESSNDGVQFRKVCELVAAGWLHMPGRQALEVPTAASFPALRAKYFRLILPRATRIANIRLSGALYITDWPRKANFAHRAGFAGGPVVTAVRSLRATGEVPRGSVIDPDSVVDISQHMDGQGQLTWEALPGRWTLLRLGHTTTGVMNHPAPDGGLGLECDKYSRAAYDFHFDHFFGKVLPAIRPLAGEGKAGAVIDSYEVGMQTWTAEFPREFERLRGYDLKRYLPAMTGRVVGSGDMSDRFLWDFRRTCADLMADGFYGRFTELCHRHGMKSHAEPYSGPESVAGPFEQMQAGSRLDVPMGEFWTARNAWRHSVKLASSIGHVFGKQVVGSEAYTSGSQFAKWQNYPFEMKAEGDWMYTQGINQFFFHTYAMQPHPSAAPGMTAGPFGWMHERTNTWFSRERAWLKYLQRCQYMLRQGLLVADLVYFTGVGVPVDTPVWPDQLSPAPPEGYYYDVANAEAILTRMGVENGRIILPDGLGYRVLTLPIDNRITLEVLRKVRDLVQQGICVVGPKPEHAPGLTRYPECDTELRRIADEIWGDLNGTTVTERTYGQGRVFWGQPMRTVLSKLNIEPDFEFSSRSGDAPINFIHRRVGDDDVYFVANRRRRFDDLVCKFRVKDKQPEIWSSESGEITPVAVYDLVDGGIRMPVRLGPAGSAFVVFRSRASARRLVSIAKDGKAVVGAEPFPAPVVGHYRGVTNNFTISVWVMPDTDMGLGAVGAQTPSSTPASFVIYPPAGAVLYGVGHAACGLVAGRNGLSVFERAQGAPSPVLVAPIPLAGWTHVAVVYKEGAPSLYVNGELIRQARSSGEVVHPGLSEAFQRDGAQYFLGNMSEPKLFSEVLSEHRIQQLALAEIPEPEEPPAIELAGSGNTDILFWRDGHYTLRDSTGRTSSVEISGIGKSEEIRGPWTVTFPSDLGAPPKVVLSELISLHKHSDPRVRYFSGTATYTKYFPVVGNAKAHGKRLYLDLGWVQVIAEVRLNGKDLGTLWKVPYRLDITEAVRAGDNKLEIRATNLWVNRLIGDEQLPPENEYRQNGELWGPGAIIRLPGWYVQGKPKPPGGRITFTTWKHYNKDSPLVESGLIGPVRLRRAVHYTKGSYK